jgi:hypothetical protein
MILNNDLITISIISSPITLDESYKLCLFTRGTIQNNTPVNVNLTGLSPDLPLTKDSLSFTYDSTSSTNDSILKEILTQIFYPINSVIQLDNISITISEYCYIQTIENVKCLKAIVTIQGVNPTNDIIGNDAIESIVTQKVSQILSTDKSLSKILSHYDSNIPYALSNNSASYQSSMVSLGNAISNLTDAHEVNYLVNRVSNMITDNSSYTSVIESIQDMSTKLGGTLINIKYIDKEYSVSLYSFIRWLIVDNTIIVDKLLIGTIQSDKTIIFDTSIQITRTTDLTGITFTINPPVNSYYIINISDISTIQETDDYTYYVINDINMTYTSQINNTSTVITSIVSTDNYSNISELINNIVNSIYILN